MYAFRNKASFYVEELLAPLTTLKPENHPSSAVRYCLFNIFAATLHIGGYYSIRNLKARHVLVTDPFIMDNPPTFYNKFMITESSKELKS